MCEGRHRTTWHCIIHMLICDFTKTLYQGKQHRAGSGVAADGQVLVPCATAVCNASVATAPLARKVTNLCSYGTAITPATCYSQVQALICTTATRLHKLTQKKQS